jgi:hypothetical protein
MERKTKKEKKEGDTCRDCWSKRFHKEIYKQWETEQEEAAGGNTIPLSTFLNLELEARELVIKHMREEFTDIYDEISDKRYRTSCRRRVYGPFQ